MTISRQHSAHRSFIICKVSCLYKFYEKPKKFYFRSEYAMVIPIKRDYSGGRADAVNSGDLRRQKGCSHRSIEGCREAIDLFRLLPIQIIHTWSQSWFVAFGNEDGRMTFGLPTRNHFPFEANWWRWFASHPLNPLLPLFLRKHLWLYWLPFY